VAYEFARLQLESQRAVELLGKAIAELGPKRTDRRRPSKSGADRARVGGPDEVLSVFTHDLRSYFRPR
jgi:hypothetical protein